jgi:hypothetical protein
MAPPLCACACIQRIGRASMRVAGALCQVCPRISWSRCLMCSKVAPRRARTAKMAASLTRLRRSARVLGRMTCQAARFERECVISGAKAPSVGRLECPGSSPDQSQVQEQGKCNSKSRFLRNDKQRDSDKNNSNGENKNKSRSPAGMTNKEATATSTASATADSYGMTNKGTATRTTARTRTKADPLRG